MPSPFSLPPIPPALQAIIDVDRKRFAGWQMMADGEAGTAGDAAGAAGGAAGGADDADTAKDAKSGDDLGEKGLAALQKERDQRKALEKEVTGLKAFQTQFTEMVAKMTGQPVEGGTEDAVKQLTDQVAALTHGNLVERVARENKITATEDVALLAEMKTEESIRTLAARLKPADSDDKSNDDGKPKGGARPRPDSSAGAGGGDDKRPTSVAQVMAERRTAREAKK